MEGFRGEVGRESRGEGRNEGRGGRANRPSLLREESTLGDGVFSASEVGSTKSEALVDPRVWGETEVP